jgi:hypothetical protein
MAECVLVGHVVVGLSAVHSAGTVAIALSGRGLGIYRLCSTGIAHLLARREKNIFKKFEIFLRINKNCNI